MRNTAAGIALLLCACAQPPPGELNPDVVSALSTEVGDAQGVAPSGVYAVELMPEDCGCEDIDPSLWTLTLCQRGAFGPVGLDATVQATFEVVTSDGIIDIASEAATANPIGALDADGTFAAGAVTRLTSFAATGYQITRVEGSVVPTGDDDYAIEGTARLRLIGRVELVGVEDIVTDVEDVDCEETVSFSGTRYIVR